MSRQTDMGQTRPNYRESGSSSYRRIWRLPSLVSGNDTLPKPFPQLGGDLRN